MPVRNLVIGSSGGIGAALADGLTERDPDIGTLRWSRSETPVLICWTKARSRRWQANSTGWNSAW